ncbi:MAG: hypothetical protein Kow0090_10860 [Myxococcota bacterium]
MRATVKIIVLCLPLLALYSDSAFGYVSHPAEHINRLFNDWQFEEGRREAEEFLKSAPEDSLAKALYAEALFYFGEYKEAKELFESVKPLLEKYPYYAEVARYNDAAYELTVDMVKHTSDDGHFILLTPAGKDEILKLYIFEPLRKAYENIGADMGYFPAPPIRIEVYDSIRDLAKATPLTEDEIKNSGTIALCKYNRLMITSPQALLRGYHWLDTLTHEFVHLVMGKASHNKLPLWLHEGMARFHESRWRGEYRELSYYDRGLLRWGLDRPAERLITFEQMHPSMAKLPSQEKTALAFAEVFYAIKFLRSVSGADSMKRIIEAVKRGEDYKDAVEEVSGMNFARFESEWKRFAGRELKVPPIAPTDYPTLYSFISMQGSEEREERSVEEIRNKKALKLVRLAEIMRSRGHIKPAIAEYRKAYRHIIQPDAVVMNRYARLLVKEKMFEEAKGVIEGLSSNFAEDISSRLNLARYYSGVGDGEKAIKYYEMANEINPYHPEIHIELRKLYEKKGVKELKEREREALEILRKERPN